MLFTRCPECDTTFRVTDETLKKANGQVRCGRCANVFNAYEELHDTAARSLEPQPPTATEPSSEQERPAEPPLAPDTFEAPAPAAVEPSAAVSEPPARSAEGEPGVAQYQASSADVIATTSPAAEPDVASATQVDAEPISATEIDRVLAADPAAPPASGTFAWPRGSEPGQRPRRSRWWGAAATLALLALATQAIHHFRSDIAIDPTFGAWIMAAYERLGIEIAPKWDVRQYQILDWVATAEPNSRGLGSLKITARIQNQGRLHQPYPAVRLRLKDRWEAAVGSRLFTPAEYLPRDATRGRLMSPSETARAEIEVVDPGPDAFGFELDVCIEGEASLVTCGTDEIFL